MKKEITLQFSSVEDLWRFWNELPYNPSQVSLQLKTITYRLSTEQVNQALSKYNAKVVETAEIQKFK